MTFGPWASCVTSSGFRVNAEAEIITNSILGAPYYNYSIIIGPQNQNPILIIKGPTLLGAQVLTYIYIYICNNLSADPSTTRPVPLT